MREEGYVPPAPPNTPVGGLSPRDVSVAVGRDRLDVGCTRLLKENALSLHEDGSKVDEKADGYGGNDRGGDGGGGGKDGAEAKASDKEERSAKGKTPNVSQ